MLRRVAPGLVLLVVTLSGCAGGGGSDPEEPDLGLEFEATATTGVIRGVVVDERIVPLAGVNVTLVTDPGLTTTTNENGAFGFEGLEPGTYFMQVALERYVTVQSSAEVVAGDPEPPIVRIILKADAYTAPYWQAQMYEGYIQCTTSFLVLCGAPNVLTGDQITNDRYAWYQSFATNASLIQAELVWDTTQALSPEMFFEAETIGCDRVEDERYEDVSGYFNNTSGASPIYVTINETQVNAFEVGEVCPIFFSLFSGQIPGTPCFDDVDPTGEVPGWCIGATVQQQFTMYFHSFHGHLPPPGWRFTVDGDPPQPA